MVTTNIKVTVETHREIQQITALLGKSQSEVVSMAMRLLMPTVRDEIVRREQLAEEIEKRIRQSAN